MKIILNSRRRHYLAIASTFLVMLALIVGMVGCGGIQVYELTIASSSGGSVTYSKGLVTYSEPKTSSYYDGTDVYLDATPDPGYQFVNWTGDVINIADRDDATTFITIKRRSSIKANFAPYKPSIAAGGYHTVGVKSDGTVVAVGDNASGQCDVSGWTNIDQVAAGHDHTVGLKSNHIVVAVGLNTSEQCDVGTWTNIIRIAAGGSHTVGVKSDGTVVAVGNNCYGQCDVSSWSLN